MANLDQIAQMEAELERIDEIIQLGYCDHATLNLLYERHSMTFLDLQENNPNLDETFAEISEIN